MTAPDTLPRELAELGELLREDPPRPAPAWAEALDQRAAAGFPRPPRRPLRFRLPTPLLLGPPAALVAAAVIALVIVLPGSGGSDDTSGGGGSSGSAAVPTAGDAAESAAPSAQKKSGGSAGSATLRAAPSPAGGGASADARPTRRQERSASVTLSARPAKIDQVSDGVVRIADAMGGYVASSNVSTRRGGTFDLRIPSRRLQRALADLSKLAHVTERTQATRDITAESVSARSRLTEARREREGLLKALAKADTLNETQSIRARLRIVNRRISSARSAVRVVDHRAAFATVAVSLVADPHAAAAPAPKDGGWTPGEALRDALDVLQLALGIALVAAAIALPIGLLALLGWLGARTTGRRRRERALDLA
jgi:Domain of unknown function (DUF4349)